MGHALVTASALSGLRRLDAHACPIAKASQHPHSVLPREAKGCHIRKAKPGDHVANDLEVSFVELAFVEGIMGPGHDLGQGPITLKVGCKLLSHCIPRNAHLLIPLLAHGRHPQGI